MNIRIIVIIFLTMWLGLTGPSLEAESASAQHQEDLPGAHHGYDLSRLGLDALRRVALDNALEQKDYKQAETILLQEVDRDGKSVRAAKLLEFAGGVFFLDGQYLNSVIAWKRAEAIAPIDERTRFTLAMAYIKLGRHQWARPELEKLVAAQAGNPLYLYWLSRIDYDDQKYTAAIVGLEKVTELDPKMARAYDLLGVCYDYLGRFDEAIVTFGRAVELNRLQSSPSPWPPLDKAVMQVELNKLPDAEKSLREAIAYNPKLAQAQYQLGRVMEKEGKYQEAIQALKLSAALDSSFPEPHYLLGRTYQKMGETDQAKIEIKQFEQLKQFRPMPVAVAPSGPSN